MIILASPSITFSVAVNGFFSSVFDAFEATITPKRSKNLLSLSTGLSAIPVAYSSPSDDAAERRFFVDRDNDGVDVDVDGVTDDNCDDVVITVDVDDTGLNAREESKVFAKESSKPSER